jgi:excinuclease ABC subunit C
VPKTTFDDRGVGLLPTEPGVYVFLDEGEKPLYVGKAGDLRSRVRAYLAGTDTRPFAPRLRQKAKTIDFVVTGTTKDALLLENSLIKRFAPRYNIRLRDDKTYFSLKLDPKEPWPRFRIVRKRKDDGAHYFGPYPSAAACRKTVRFLNTLYPMRTCPDSVLNNRERPCLDYEIGRCVAPCVGLTTVEAYAALVDKAARVLSGKEPDVAVAVEREMDAAAERLDFERAAELRDVLADLRTTVERAGKVVGRGVERDVLAVAAAGDEAVVATLSLRGPVLIGAETRRVRNVGDGGEILSAFLGQYYGPGRPVPEQILLSETPPDLDDHVAVLSERRIGGVEIRTPERGEGLRWTRLAQRNADLSAARSDVDEDANKKLATALREALGLAHQPERIECYDVSHFSGGEAVASGVAFSDGLPDKTRYRRYRIREAAGGDDFASLEEVLRRRLRRGLSEGDLPDLVVVDGGRPQVRRVVAVFRELKVPATDVIGLAKARTGARAAARFGTFERVVLPDRDEPIILPQDSPELLYLARMRDEAHRFAIDYGRRRLRKKATTSALELAPGIGVKTARALLRAFGDLAAVKAASVEALAAAPGMTRARAEAVRRFFSERAEGAPPPPPHEPSSPP